MDETIKWTKILNCCYFKRILKYGKRRNYRIKQLQFKLKIIYKKN